MCEAGDVPVGRPHATVAGEGADAVGVVGAVDADSGLAEADPCDSDGIVRTAGEHEKLIGTDASVEHSLVPAKVGHRGNAEDAPFPRRSGMGA